MRRSRQKRCRRGRRTQWPALSVFPCKTTVTLASVLTNLTQNVLNVQPVIPAHIATNWNLITRIIQPIVWQPYDLIAIDEVGYVPMADLGAEFLFQVIAERAEKAAVIVTTNLPFSEWTQVSPNPRLPEHLTRGVIAI